MSNEGHIFTHAVSGLRHLSRKVKGEENRFVLKNIADVIYESVKFTVPDEGYFFDEIKLSDSWVSIAKMPYNNLAIAFNTPESEIVRHEVVYAFLNKEKDTVHIGAACEDRNHHGVWTAAPFNLIAPYPFKLPLKDIVLSFLGSAGKGCYPKSHLESMKLHFIGVIIQFCQVMNCSNALVSDHQPSVKINKRRECRGKLPFMGYKTLMVTVPKDSHRHEHMGGSHASPRVHLRRGHIRRHPTAGAIWIQPMLVGDKTAGIIHKDYRVKRAI